MRNALLLPLLSIPAALAVPSPEFQTVLNSFQDIDQLSTLTGGIFGNVRHGLEAAMDRVEKVILDGQGVVENWFEDGREFIKQYDIECR